ncbi:zinc finger MYM-type 1-like [Pelobates cultripes]|uniref:Zinc finger MYM-type 1-like n=1 Tax=Pelobates cultripes TaxID=61616 RepID=A0AAD1T239_PELCU|nr:zinc finger MYM-type 1-like [Pelobates cultripes]
MDRFVIKKPKKANTSVSVVNTVPEHVAAKSAEEDISVGSDQCSLHSENVPIDDVVCSSVLQASSLDEAEDVIFFSSEQSSYSKPSDIQTDEPEPMCSSSECQAAGHDQTEDLTYFSSGLSSQSTSYSKKQSNIAADDPVCSIPQNRFERQNRVARGPYQPKLSMFPRTKIGNKERNFQSDWYGKYRWLEYSPAKDAAFCFYCRCFSSNDATQKGHADPAFIEKGFRNWHRANECFKTHQQSKSHMLSTSAWSSFSEGKHIDVLLDESKKVYLSKKEEERCKNRNLMKRLIDIVRCLGTGGRPFRGHNEKADSHERGLFLNIVKLLEKYDPVMQRHLQESPRNATYLSNRIQNDLIMALHNIVQQKIVSAINGKMISIIADDTADCGHHEQMSVVVRYFNNEQQSPVEHFVSIQRLLKVDAQSIFDQINNVLEIIKTDWSSVISVCFDGASTMSGCTAGVQMKCKEKNHEILYVHCYAHCLNLVLVDACTSSRQNRTVFDFFGIIQTLYAFMEGSPVRHAVMEKISQEVGTQLKTLKSLSNTRWACRAEAVAAVKENFSVILQALNEIIESSRLADAKIKARGLICELNSFKFIFALHMMHPILQMVVKVSKTLQASNLNLLTAMTVVKSLRNSLVSMRSETDYFQSIFHDCEKKCAENNIAIPPVRKRKPSVLLDEAAAQSQYHYETKEEQERITSFYPLLDSLITGIDQRFEQESCDIVTAVGKLLNLEIPKGDIQILANKFKVSVDELEAEAKLLREYDGPTPKGCTTNTIKEWLDWFKESD